MNDAPSSDGPSAAAGSTSARSILLGRVRFKPDVLIQQVGGESVLLDLQSEQYFGLDPVGTRIMTLINESPSVAVALDRVAEDYEVDRPTLEADTLELIADCVAQGLLVVDPAPSA